MIASIYWWLGFFVNYAVTKVANIISGLVSTIENIIESVIL